MKIEVPDIRKWSKSGILIFLTNFQVISNNFCFHDNEEKSLFGPLLNEYNLYKDLYLPNIG